MTLALRWICASVVGALCWIAADPLIGQAVQSPPSLDCPASIARHPGATYYSGTVTVYAGNQGDCVVRLPDGVTLRIGGGSAPNRPHARAVFRINGDGIDKPGGINILVSASPVPASSIPDFSPLRLPAHLTLPKNTMLVRWDPSGGRWVLQSSDTLQGWALYKVLRHGVQPLQQASLSWPKLLPATGLGATTLGARVSRLLWGDVELVGVGVFLAAILSIAIVLTYLWQNVRRGFQLGSSVFWTHSLLVFIAVVALVLDGQYVWMQSAVVEQLQYGDILAQGATPKKPSATAPPDRLTLTRLGIDTPVITTSIENQMWQLASYSAGYLPLGVVPGERGNLVIAGHDDKDGAVFKHLRSVHKGDIVSLYVSKSIYRYRVTALGIILPTQLSVLYSTSGAVLTLITCTPQNVDTQRLIVRALLVS